MGIKNVKLKMRYIFVAVLCHFRTASSARNSRVRREESEECVPDHELEMFCQNNSEEDCASSVICSWCEDSCNVNGTAVASCLSNKDGRNQTIFECVFELKKSALAEGKSLSSEEQKLILDTIGDLPADEENSEARSGFMGLFTGDSAFGMRSDPMIPYDLMGVQSRISAQFINCPVNVPFCQRQECSSSFGNPQQNAMDCYRIAGCCFDNNLFVYKSAFGGSFFPAPVCYRAIRTPIFHALAEQITMKTNFLPNFLVPIADKVDVFLGDENRFNLMLEYHQCLSGAKMAPSRLRLENYLTQVWPGYIWMRMRPQGDNFLEALVDTLSQTCGWDDINSRECMMIGCCWSGMKNRCTHPTDLTKIQPQKLIATATWMLTTMDRETATTTAPTIATTEAGQPPIQQGVPPIFGQANNDARSGEGPDVGIPDDEAFNQLFAGLSGRRRRSGTRGGRRRRQNGRTAEQTEQSNGEARQGLSRMTPIDTMNLMAGNFNNMGPNNIGNIMANNMGNNMMGNMGLNMGGNMNGGNMGLGQGMGQAGLLQNMMLNRNPALGAGIGSNNLLGNQLMNSLSNTMSGLGNINTALFQQMGVSNQNPFFATNAQVPTCPRTPAKLNCMAPPAEDEKIDAMFMLNTPKMCEVKGCCWDQGLMQQLLLARKSDSINNIQQFQCPWRAPTVGSKWGLPDLSESLKGCCSISPCVHTELPAEWTLWGEWTQCAAKCGGGESIRSRSCIGNGFCPGMIDDTQREDIVSRVCGQVPCESWSLWAPWGQCSASCGKGTHQRFRSCTDINGLDVAPPGVSGGCRGNDASSQPCRLQPCPEWGHWRQWSQCSTSCGIGSKTRQRVCNLPGQCVGPDREMSSCGQACWSDWNQWSACSKTCYGGEHTRSRECKFQAETGMTCSGSSIEQGKCNEQYCERWLTWQPWSSCSDGANVCGEGSKARVRECTGTPGAPGCQGSSLDTRKCVIGTCQWSEWAQASSCSKTCGDGLAYYTRTCNRMGQCPGEDRKQLSCSVALCPGFQEWSTWSECSATCGAGRTERTRKCNGQVNIDCRGSLNQIKSCSNRACPHQFGAQPNPYGTQLDYNNYNNNNNNNQAYGSNTNSFLNQMTNRQNQGQTNVNPYNNLFGGSTTNNQNTQSNLNQYNKLFGSSTTNNQGYFNQMQANPWEQ